jgi:hypothetical protein
MLNFFSKLLILYSLAWTCLGHTFTLPYRPQTSPSITFVVDPNPVPSIDLNAIIDLGYRARFLLRQTRETSHRFWIDYVVENQKLHSIGTTVAGGSNAIRKTLLRLQSKRITNYGYGLFAQHDVFNGTSLDVRGVESRVGTLSLF